MPEDTQLELEVRWKESGSEFLSRIGSKIRELNAHVSGTSNQFEHLGRAMRRLEAREPLILAHELRLELSRLTAEAVGLESPLARLATTFASFGVGGVMGTAIIGGFVAIGLEVRTILEYTEKLDKQLMALNTRAAQMVGGGAAAAANLVALRAAEPTQPGALSRLFARLGSFGAASGEGDFETALRTGMAAEEATQQTMTGFALAQFHKQHLDLIEKAAQRQAELNKVMGESFIHLQSERDALQMTSAERLKLKNFEIDLAVATMQQLTPAEQEILAGRLHEIEALKETNRLTQERTSALAKMGFAQPTTPDERAMALWLNQFAVGQGPVGRRVGFESQLGGADVATMGILGFTGGVGGAGGPFPGAGPKDWFGRPIKELEDAVREIPALLLSGGGKIGITPEGAAELARQQAKVAATVQAAQLIGAGFNLITAAAGGGGGGAILGALGGIASVIPGGQIPGAILSGLGAVASLFGGGEKPKVIIDGYSADALTQQEQLMLATLGFKGVIFETLAAGRSSDQVAYDMATRSRLDAIPRRPPGGARGG